MYVAGNYYTAEHTKSTLGTRENHPVSGPWQKGKEWAPTIGTMIGFGAKFYENWNTIRPFIAGVQGLVEVSNTLIK